MPVTLLQPLLILAAIAIVGVVPLLGAASPVATIGVNAMSASGAHTAPAQRNSADLARASARHTRAMPASAHDRSPSLFAQALAERSWAVRCGACVLPPPRA
jgi:hypothetical protein